MIPCYNYILQYISIRAHVLSAVKDFSMDFPLVFSVERDLTVLFNSCLVFLKDTWLCSV